MVPSEPDGCVSQEVMNRPRKTGVHTASGKCAVNRMERYIIYCIDQRLVFGIGRLIPTVAFKRKVVPEHGRQNVSFGTVRLRLTKNLFRQRICGDAWLGTHVAARGL